jgi:hypothetical protein
VSTLPPGAFAAPPHFLERILDRARNHREAREDTADTVEEADQRKGEEEPEHLFAPEREIDVGCEKGAGEDQKSDTDNRHKQFGRMEAKGECGGWGNKPESRTTDTNPPTHGQVSACRIGRELVLGPL